MTGPDEMRRKLAAADDELTLSVLQILDAAVRFGHPAERNWHERIRNSAKTLPPWAEALVAQQWLAAGFRHLPGLGPPE